MNSFPADTINFLNSISKTEGVLHGQSLYGFIQGGMPYVHTHENGINLLELFCDENEVEFKGGFVMGGGAMLDGQPLEKIVGAKQMVAAVNQFIDNIKNNRNSDEELYKEASLKMPLLITKMLAFAMSHNLKRDLRKKGIDYKAKSPYFIE